MRRRYSYNKLIELIRIRNRFSYSKPNEITDSDERVAIRSPVRSPDNDNDDMDFQYDHKDDLSFRDINDDNNAYGSINPQDYNDEMIFSQDNINSSNTEEKEESDNEYNYEEEEGEENNNENNDEEEEDEGNNDDNNNQVKEERNNDEEKCNSDEEKCNSDKEERNNEEEEIHQIVEALDKDKIPFCNTYEDLVDIIHNPQFEPAHMSIKISPKKTLSTSRGSKLLYQLSISEIICQKKLRRLRSILKNDNGYYQLQIQKILEYSDLPRNLKGKSNYIDDVQHQNIPEGSLWISEIIYKCGVYIQFGNIPAHQRKLIKNHFVIRFIPFGGKFDEFMIPFISEMKELEKGKVMTVQGQDA
ncbi:hypothetical protein C1646_764538 [Rhizophagus diaphanus]|nr:hypothetical protein C1646_764538 [Rhizophagus diaphanus] [Rhizophagus sp. MUCL 43196]